MAATIQTSDRWLRLTTTDGDLAREAVLRLERAGLDTDDIAIEGEVENVPVEHLDRRGASHARNHFVRTSLLAVSAIATLAIAAAVVLGASTGAIVAGAIGSLLVGFVFGGLFGMRWTVPARTLAPDVAAPAERWTVMATAPDSRIAEIAGTLDHLSDEAA